MKIIAVSQRIDQFKERNEIRDSLDQRLVEFVLACGYLPVVVPNRLGSLLTQWLINIKPNGIMLSGGNSLGAEPVRDRTELTLIEYAYKHKLALLGICRGMQLIAHWSGAEMKKVSGHVSTTHQVRGEINRYVNSYHEMTISSCPDGFRILATSNDGEIEAIRSSILNWEGWMWHPERTRNYDALDMRRMQSIFG